MNQLHDGHRERLRKKFETDALLEDHEILELYLFQSIPRCNTNEIAHRLLQRFGSIRGVLHADISSLEEVEGVGHKTAVQLRVASALVSRYLRSSVNTSGILNDVSELYLYLQSLFAGIAHERVYAVLFNASGRLVGVKQVANGISFLSDVAISSLIHDAVKQNAAALLLAHNHPDGLPFPSEQDRRTTFALRDALRGTGIRLVEHYVIAGDSCHPTLYE